MNADVSTVIACTHEYGSDNPVNVCPNLLSEHMCLIPITFSAQLDADTPSRQSLMFHAELRQPQCIITALSKP